MDYKISIDNRLIVIVEEYEKKIEKYFDLLWDFQVQRLVEILEEEQKQLSILESRGTDPNLENQLNERFAKWLEFLTIEEENEKLEEDDDYFII